MSPVFWPFLSWLRRPSAWILAAVVVFLLALGARARPVLRARSLPTGDAQWIWRPIDRLDHAPTAFYALRDFDLPDPPPPRARLLITAEEEYVLTLNGRRIGAGTFRQGAPLDVYEVGPLLLPEGNRLLVELRSGKGAGGLLASLVDATTGRPLVVTDERWRIFQNHELGLVRGWIPGDKGERAFRWGAPPLGRWGTPRAGSLHPLRAFDTAPRLPAASVLPYALPAGLASPRPGRPAGSPVLYDWGRPVEGYLTLGVPPGKLMGVALVYAGEEPPDPLRSKPTASVLIQAGRRDWMDATPRRFRYALLVGLARPATAGVIPAPAAPPTPPVESRVFGVQGPPLRTPVEDEVWSKLQRLPGVARRKEL